MRRLFFDFFSHRDLFYGLFNQAAKNMVEMSSLLPAVIAAAPDARRQHLYRKIDSLEESGDDITHRIYLALDKVFFTPMNRKDIHQLASAIDDVADNLHEAAGRMKLYEIEMFIPSIAQMAGNIHLCCTELQRLVGDLPATAGTDCMLASCRAIGHHERQTGVVYYRALAELFAQEKDPIELIKNRDILLSLGVAASKCKKVADTLELIALGRL